MHRLAIVDFRHATNTSAAQPGILVGVAPAINGSLNEATLAPQARVELRQRPSNGVALGLVHQPVPTVLVFAAARAWVNAVFGLEFRAQGIHADRLHVASDGVLHLDAIARILESNPLHAIIILSNNQRCSCWDWARGSIWVNAARTSTRNVVLLHLRTIWRMLRRSQRLLLLLLRWPLDLRYVWLHLGSWAARHAWLLMLARMLLQLLVTRLM